MSGCKTFYPKVLTASAVIGHCIDVNGGIEAVHMREKEEHVLTELGLKRNESYYMDSEEE